MKLLERSGRHAHTLEIIYALGSIYGIVGLNIGNARWFTAAPSAAIWTGPYDPRRTNVPVPLTHKVTYFNANREYCGQMGGDLNPNLF